VRRGARSIRRGGQTKAIGGFIDSRRGDAGSRKCRRRAQAVTALFADIKGSTDLMEDLDPEEARAIIDPALKLMIDAAHRYEGYVVQSTGDGIFASFGAPAAHEDHPPPSTMPSKENKYGPRALASHALLR
jgi:class 3 adenylate cyclase